MPVVRRAAKPFWSSLLERYWPETEDPSNELGSTVSFKAPVFIYVTDLARLFALAKGWVITIEVPYWPYLCRVFGDVFVSYCSGDCSRRERFHRATTRCRDDGSAAA